MCAGRSMPNFRAPYTESSTMYCARGKRKWASKSRIGAYIRGEIKLEDMMHPSKIVKPKERHNRRSYTIYAEFDANCSTLLSGDKIVVRKDVESKIRPYIEGLKTVKDLMHPSKLTDRVNISSQALPAFLELVKSRNFGLRNAIMYDAAGGAPQAMDSSDELSSGAAQRTNFENLLTILEGNAGNGSADAVISIRDGANQRYVTVVVSDHPRSEEQPYADDGENSRVLSWVAKSGRQGGDEEIHLVDDDLVDVDANVVTVVDGEYFAYLAKSLRPIRGDDGASSAAASEPSPNERNCVHDDSSTLPVAVFDDSIFRHKNAYVVRSPRRRQRLVTTDACHRNRRAQNTSNERLARDPLVTELYQKIRTLLEERVESLARSQRQFDKMETLQRENHHLRAVMTKIGEKLNDIEGNVDSFSARRLNGDTVGPESSLYQQKLRTQNQHLLKTIAAMNTYLLNFESESAESGECIRQRDATVASMERYKNLYEKEVKNFKRHKRKCEAHHRDLIQRCNQLHQRIQELDTQNLEMAAKLSYVPVKLQLACRQYQDIIKKLNDDLNCLRSLERKSKSTFIMHDKSYPKNFTWH